MSLVAQKLCALMSLEVVKLNILGDRFFCIHNVIMTYRYDRTPSFFFHYWSVRNEILWTHVKSENNWGFCTFSCFLQRK